MDWDWGFIVGGFTVSGRPIPLPPADRLALLRAEVLQAQEARLWDEALIRVFGTDLGSTDILDDNAAT